MSVNIKTGGDLLSVTEAAELMSCTRQNIWFLIMLGKVSAFKIGTQYAIFRTSLEEYRNRNNKATQFKKDEYDGNHK